MCPPMKSDSLDFECTFEDKYISCLNPVPGTILYQTCKVTHKLPSGQEQAPIQLHCLENGIWSGADLYTCIPSIFSLLLYYFVLSALYELIALK